MGHILYEVVDRVARITLNRPEKANAQSPDLLEALHEAWMRAAGDDEVRVIVLRAEGRHFSSGHDLSLPVEAYPFRIDEHVGIGEHYAFEAEVFVNYCKLWRNVPKPSIAAVQGATVAAGLM